jgi:phage terminase large subunit-like protein
MKPYVCSKFFSDWMLCSKEDALIISDEMKYWDGYYLVKGKRQPSITTVIKRDADAIQYFFTVSGIRASLRSDGRKGQIYKTYGKDYIRKRDTYQISPTDQVNLNLSRKIHGKLKIERVESGKFKYCFEVPSGFFVMRRGGDITLTGNSGKSRLLLNKAAYFAHNDANFEGVMFRRNIGPLRSAGGLFSEAKKLYGQLGVDIREQAMEVIFHGEGGSKNNKLGGNLKFTHLEHENDAEGNHQGLQYSFVGFDELTHFYQSQFLYLIGRMRSAAEGNSFLLATTNPDCDSWVYDWVQYYLLDGKFDENKLGVIRYFLIVDDSPVFGDKPEDLAEQYPDLCYIENPHTGETQYVPPMSYCFIGGNIFDNPELIRQNPKYLSALKAQTKVNRARLLDGRWDVRAEGSNLFQRSWLTKINKIPKHSVCVRAWDIAHSEPSDKYRYPDYTASIKMYKTRESEFIIAGDFDPEIKDPKTDVVGRFRKRFGDRNNWMLQQAQYDGSSVVQVIPQENGAGKGQYEDLVKMYTNNGFRVVGIPTGNQKGGKLKRFSVFSSACQNGIVHILEDTFENKATLEAFYKELEAFDGSPSTGTVKDDWVDTCSDCVTALNKIKVRKPMSAGTSTATKLAEFRNH